jgi:phospholipid/cholesterol/gamma-HCH transport system ATP-binding protein
MEQLALKKMEMVGLKTEAAFKKPSELSGGMVKRAALARALALDPRILFLDEPTAGLDPIAAASFDELIGTLREILGLSVLIITHDLDTLTGLCDRIAMLVDKKITAGTLQDMMQSQHPWIKEYFTGPRMRAALYKG